MSRRAPRPREVPTQPGGRRHDGSAARGPREAAAVGFPRPALTSRRRFAPADPRLDPTQREVARVVRGAYLAALNARDGKRACALFGSRALAAVDFPRDRGNRAASSSASIAYEIRAGSPPMPLADRPPFPR